MTTQVATVIPPGFDDLLASTALAHVATIGPKGEPQSSPVWFHWDGSHLRFGQAEGRQKAKNLRRDPHVAISIVDPANPFRYLEIRGRVTAMEPDPDKTFIRLVSMKYLGNESFAEQPGDYVTLVVEPVHTTTMGG